MKVDWPLKASLIRHPTMMSPSFVSHREYYQQVVSTSKMEYPFEDNELQGFKVMIRYYQRYYPQHCI